MQRNTYTLASQGLLYHYTSGSIYIPKLYTEPLDGPKSHSMNGASTIQQVLIGFPEWSESGAVNLSGLHGLNSQRFLLN